MTFPIDKFSKIGEPELIVDVRIPNARLKRNRTLGHLDPYWMIPITTIPLDYDTGMGLNAYINSLFGAYTKFDLPNPYPQPNPHGVTLVRTNAAKGNSSFVIDGLIIDQVDAIKAGHFIRFENHDMIYQITLNADADGFNEATVNITPPLQENIAALDNVYMGDDVIFPVSIEDRSSATIDAKNGKFMTISLEVITQI